MGKLFAHENPSFFLTPVAPNSCLLQVFLTSPHSSLCFLFLLQVSVQFPVSALPSFGLTGSLHTDAYISGLYPLGRYQEHFPTQMVRTRTVSRHHQMSLQGQI